MQGSAALALVAASPYEGVAYRHQGPGYDPLSGEGARYAGGRFNPPGSFPVLYLCETRPCAVAELQRLGHRQAIGLEGLLPRHLYQYRVRLSKVLDLADDDALKALDLARGDLTGPSWEVTQELGVAAHGMGWQAILSDSATGADRVLAVFPEAVGSGLLTSELVERWTRREDL